MGKEAALCGLWNSSPQSCSVTFGCSGTFTTSTRGLTAATQNPGTVSDDPANTFVVDGQGVTAHFITVAPGTTYARFALYDDEVAAGNDRLPEDAVSRSSTYERRGAGGDAGPSGRPGL